MKKNQVMGRIFHDIHPVSVTFDCLLATKAGS